MKIMVSVLANDSYTVRNVAFLLNRERIIPSLGSGIDFGHLTLPVTRVDYGQSNNTCFYTKSAHKNQLDVHVICDLMPNDDVDNDSDKLYTVGNETFGEVELYKIQKFTDRMYKILLRDQYK